MICWGINMYINFFRGTFQKSGRQACVYHYNPTIAIILEKAKLCIVVKYMYQHIIKAQTLIAFPITVI